MRMFLLCVFGSVSGERGRTVLEGDTDFMTRHTIICSSTDDALQREAYWNQASSACCCFCCLHVTKRWILSRYYLRMSMRVLNHFSRLIQQQYLIDLHQRRFSIKDTPRFRRP